MPQIYNRRTFLHATAAFAALSLAGCGAMGDGAPTTSQTTLSGPVSLSLLFWGTTTRNTLTQNAIALFEKQNKLVTFTSQYKAFTDIWGLLDQQIAAGKTPDLIQMDMRYVARYAKAEVMLDLTQMIYDQKIQLGDFDPLVLEGSKANDAVYGIPLGGNFECLLYDATLLDQSGVTVDAWNWDTFAQQMVAITTGLGGKVYGVGDSSGDFSVFEIWLRQSGRELYTVDGQLAFTSQDVQNWFSFWYQLRQSKGCVPADVQAAMSLREQLTRRWCTVSRFSILATPTRLSHIRPCSNTR